MEYAKVIEHVTSCAFRKEGFPLCYRGISWAEERVERRAER